VHNSLRQKSGKDFRAVAPLGDTGRTSKFAELKRADADRAQRGEAGVLIGNILVRVAGQPAPSLHEVRNALAGHIGEEVHLDVLRGGAPTELRLTVGQWPAGRQCC
jgi:hypothetical protein